MTIRLIVNADDYGRSANISRGIRQAHVHGIVTSTTCMMNMPDVVNDIRIASDETPRLGLGVHLVLTAGRPLLPAQKVSSLVQADGSFLKLEKLVARHAELDGGEARAEWRAQIDKFMNAAGRKPTHLDSHHHSSYFTPALFQSMLELADEYKLPIRLPIATGAGASLLELPVELVEPMMESAPRLLSTFLPRHPDAFYASFYDERATHQELRRIFENLHDGSFEVMSHPGYSDPELADSSGYAKQRETELEILTSAAVLDEIKKRNIELISFAQL